MLLPQLSYIYSLINFKIWLEFFCLPAVHIFKFRTWHSVFTGVDRVFQILSEKKISTRHGTMSSKNRDMSDKCYFITSTVVLRKVKKNYRRLKTQKHLLNMGLYRFFMKISINNLLMQFFHIINCMMWSSKMILYQYLVVAFLLRTSSPMKTLYMLLNSNT